jgi:hypothetical protein
MWASPTNKANLRKHWPEALHGAKEGARQDVNDDDAESQ